MAGMISYISIITRVILILIPILFIVVTAIYWNARKNYSGNLLAFIDTMILFGIFAILTGIIRFVSDSPDLGFSRDCNLKWLQNILYIAESAIFLLAGYRLANLFRGRKG